LAVKITVRWRKLQSIYTSPYLATRHAKIGIDTELSEGGQRKFSRKNSSLPEAPGSLVQLSCD
jgi:hypothetical protein